MGNTKRALGVVVAVAPFVVLAAAACVSSNEPTPSTFDAAAQLPVDATVDGPRDASPDVTVDAAPDVTVDSPAEAAPIADASDAAPPDDAGADADSAADAAKASYFDTVMSDTPIGYWRFGEATGAGVAVDELGTTAGTYSNVTLGVPGAIAGDPNTAMTLDGVQGQVAMGTAFEFGGNVPMTIEMWLKIGAGNTGYQRVISREGFVNGTNRDGYLWVYRATEGLSVERWNNNVGDGYIGALPATLDDGAFHHVVMTYDGANLALYVDGNAAQSTAIALALPALSYPFYVGVSGQGPAYFSGSIDELAVYDKALSAARIAAHHTVGTTP